MQFPSSAPSVDRDALVALYRSACGMVWHNSRHWDTDTDLSQWYGVEVNDEGRVVKLRLDANNLQRMMPVPFEMRQQARKSCSVLTFLKNSATGIDPFVLVLRA